jgi:2-oxoisovalerate ferredoxin oxidoreductase beta subunit
MYALTYRRPKSFYGVFERKPDDHLTTHYCPGCGHGNIHKYIAEAIDDLGIQDRTIFISPVGCSVFAYYYFDVGNIQAAHGRAAAVATAVKRARPESIVISYQGDGDLAAIGGNEILHAANRGENITVIFVNNALYGMTGGQMAPTTLIGQKTTTTPRGRDVLNEGSPLRVCELLATLDGPVYIERVAVFDTRSRMKARRAIRKALQAQIEGKGFSLVEVLSPCPTGWGLTPEAACRWIKEEMLPVFPLGVFKDETAKRPSRLREKPRVPLAEIPTLLGLREPEIKGRRAVAEGAAGYRNPRIKIAGFGGQGVLFLGTILAESGMRQGYHVSWLPSYGPEMRGGTAHCHVTLSDEPIGSPLISHPTVLMAMNRPSLDRFEAEVTRGGLLIYNATLCDRAPVREDLEVMAVAATDIADRLGGAQAANMVILGAYIGRTKLLAPDLVEQVLEKNTKKAALVELNRAAFRAGLEWASYHPGAEPMGSEVVDNW